MRCCVALTFFVALFGGPATAAEQPSGCLPTNQERRANVLVAGSPMDGFISITKTWGYELCSERILGTSPNPRVREIWGPVVDSRRPLQALRRGAAATVLAVNLDDGHDDVGGVPRVRFKDPSNDSAEIFTEFVTDLGLLPASVELHPIKLHGDAATVARLDAQIHAITSMRPGIKACKCIDEYSGGTYSDVADPMQTDNLRLVAWAPPDSNLGIVRTSYRLRTADGRTTEFIPAMDTLRVIDLETGAVTGHLGAERPPILFRLGESENLYAISSEQISGGFMDYLSYIGSRDRQSGKYVALPASEISGMRW